MRSILSILLLSLISLTGTAQEHKTTIANRVWADLLSYGPSDSPGVQLTRYQSFDMNLRIWGMDLDTITDGFFVVADSERYVILSNPGIIISDVTRIFLSSTALPVPMSVHIPRLLLPAGDHILYVYHSDTNPVATLHVTVREATAVLPVEPQKEIEVYPNPSSDLIHVRVPASTQLQSVSLTDANGRLIKKLDAQGISIDVPISDMTPGLYLMQLHTDKDVIVKRVAVGR